MTASSEYKLGGAGARGLRALLSAAVIATLGLLVPVFAWAVDTAPPAEVKSPTVNAVWVEHEFSFTYMGLGTYYSCDGLRNKIEHVLEAIGARKDPKVTVACLDTIGIETLPMARIRVAVPTAATPELLRQLEDDQSRRELVERVQGKGGGVDVATAQFPAELRVVEFDGRRGRRVEDGDCELLSQLLPQVLKPLGVRELPGSALRYVPKQSQFGAVRLRLESLHALPPPAPPAR